MLIPLSLLSITLFSFFERGAPTREGNVTQAYLHVLSLFMYENWTNMFFIIKLEIMRRACDVVDMAKQTISKLILF